MNIWMPTVVFLATILYQTAEVKCQCTLLSAIAGFCLMFFFSAATNENDETADVNAVWQPLCVLIGLLHSSDEECVLVQIDYCTRLRDPQSHGSTAKTSLRYCGDN